MKYFLMFFACITTLSAEPDWVMIKCSTPLSYQVRFDCLKEDELTDTVIRTGLFTPRYYYDLYSADGMFLARAVNRVLSLGMLSSSQIEFDVYDEEDSYIGYIGGHLWTMGRAKFEFTNAKGEQTGFALLNSDSLQATFSILSPSNMVLAMLNGTLSGDLSKWELEEKKSLTIDSRILKIFTAFISDFHHHFIQKPEIHNHHYNFELQNN
ncbi:MAG: hypothetical protein FJZ58_05090 [Chlamydiae bacterium]|nr:hypothetical protein [Chlamydiota bacterium]